MSCRPPGLSCAGGQSLCQERLSLCERGGKRQHGVGSAVCEPASRGSRWGSPPGAEGVCDRHLPRTVPARSRSSVPTVHHSAATKEFPSMATDTMTKVRLVFCILENYSTNCTSPALRANCHRFLLHWQLVPPQSRTAAVTSLTAAFVRCQNVCQKGCQPLPCPVRFPETVLSFLGWLQEILCMS